MRTRGRRSAVMGLDGFVIFLITLLFGCPRARAEPIVELSGATGLGVLAVGVTSGRFALSPSASFKSTAKTFATTRGRSVATIAHRGTETAFPSAPMPSLAAFANVTESASDMIELTFLFKSGEVSQDITIRLFDVKQVRGADSPAPWDVSVTITWGGTIMFDRSLAGADPLHAVELAAQFAARYLCGRAQDEGGTLEPPIMQP